MVGVKVKNIYGNYQCRQSSVVLDIQPYFFCFLFCRIWGLLFALFRSFEAIFGVGIKLKNLFGTYLHRLKTFILEV